MSKQVAWERRNNRVEATGVQERETWEGHALRKGERVQDVIMPSSLWPMVWVGLLTFPVLFGFGAIIARWWVKQNKWAVTDQRVIELTGVFNKKMVSVDYDRITDVSFDRPFWSPIARNGTVFINTAGGDKREIRIYRQPEPDEVASYIDSMR